MAAVGSPLQPWFKPETLSIITAAIIYFAAFSLLLLHIGRLRFKRRLRNEYLIFSYTADDVLFHSFAHCRFRRNVLL